MDKLNRIKKTISLILIISFLSTNSAYSLPIKEHTLRPPLQTAPGNVAMQRILLNEDNGNELFTEDQKEEIRKEIRKYCKSHTRLSQIFLTRLLKSGLITEANQEKLFTIFKEIPQYARDSTGDVYHGLTDLLESGLITQVNQEQILKDFAGILKEISQYKEYSTWEAYYSLNDLFKSGLITRVNQKQIFTILKEIPRYAKEGTTQALNSLISLLEALKQKQIILTQNDLNIIINMIKSQGDVSATLNVIKELVMEVKAPEEGQDLGNSNTLSAMLLNSMQIYAPANETQGVSTLASNETVFTPLEKTTESKGFTEEQEQEILKEIQKYCGHNIQGAKEALGRIYKSGLVAPQNQAVLFRFLKEIPQYTKDFTLEAYYSLVGLLRPGLIREANREQIFNIIKEILQYAGLLTERAYESLAILLKSGLITETNQEQILRGFLSILKEISQYAGFHMPGAYDEFANLLESGLITETNQGQIFIIVKEIPRYAGEETPKAFQLLTSLLESIKEKQITLTQNDITIIINMIKDQGDVLVTLNIIKELVMEVKDPDEDQDNNTLSAMLLNPVQDYTQNGKSKGTTTLASNETVSTSLEKTDDFKGFGEEQKKEILEEIQKYCYFTRQEAEKSLEKICKSGLITSQNQEAFFTILKEIPKYAEAYIPETYDTLTNLLKSGLITEANQKQIFTILKEILQYARGSAWRAYDILTNFLKLSLIIEANQEQILSIAEEIPQYAGKETFQAFNSLISLLEALQQKQINLTENNLTVIINMIRNQGEVSATFTVIKDLILEVRDPDEDQGRNNSNTLSAMLLNPVRDYKSIDKYQKITTLASNETVFTEEQKDEILKDIREYCGSRIQEAEVSLQKIYKSNMVTLQNQEAIFIILKEMPRYAEVYTPESYDSLTNLLKLGLVTKTNQEQILRDFSNILKKVPQYAKNYTLEAYTSLTNLLKSGLITKTNQEQMFNILKEIPQYARICTPEAYNSLVNLFKSGLITETNQEQILKDFLSVLKEISQYAGNNAWQAYNSLAVLLESSVITKTNQEQIFTILKEVPQYVRGSIWAAYDSLNNLLELNLITEANQEQVFTIVKEIPKYAGGETFQAFNSLISLLEALKQKQITLTGNDVTVIINMIKDQGDVSATLNVIKDLVLEFKAPDEGHSYSNTLSAMLLNSMQIYTPTNERQGITILASNETVFIPSQKTDNFQGFTKEQKEEILKEIWKHCNHYDIEEKRARKSLQKIYKSSLITSRNREILFTILKEIPQYAGTNTPETYDSITDLHKSGLITEADQEQIFYMLKEIPQYAVRGTPSAYNSLINILFKLSLIIETDREKIFNILKEIPQYAKDSTYKAYDSLTKLFESGLITKANQEQILRDFSNILLKEIPQYAGNDMWGAYHYLAKLLEFGLIAQTNQEQIFTIIKEIPQYAKSETSQVFQSLTSLLEALKQKQITLTENDVTVIINMIKEQGDVSATLNVINELVMEVKDHEEGQDNNTLSAMLLNPAHKDASAYKYQGTIPLILSSQRQSL